MTLLRTALMAAGLLLAVGTATGASAKIVVVTDVETGYPDLGNVSVPGYGAPWTTPIIMTEQGIGKVVVFCDDLNHVVYVEGGQNLHYLIGQVTVDGNGNPLKDHVSNEMGQLADIGRYDFSKGDEAGAIAAQAAIWGLEYGVAVTSSDGAIQHDITADLKVTDDGRGLATGLIGLDNQQSQITGGVPEPAAWAMMLMGFGGLGAAMRGARRRQGLAV